MQKSRYGHLHRHVAASTHLLEYLFFERIFIPEGTSLSLHIYKLKKT